MCPGVRYAGLDLPAGAGGLRPAFDVLDADHDGRISRDDLKTFYANAGATDERFDDEDIEAMIAAADADLDGFVQYHEFEGLLGRAAKAGMDGGCRSAMEDAFRLMDRDGDGKVGFEDLKAYLGWAGMPVADDEIRAMISMAGDGDGGVDGKVGFEDLKAYLGWAGMPVADDEIRAMISMAGDGDGGVGLEALARILAVDFDAIV